MLKSQLAVMKSLNYDGRTILSGRSGGKRAWGNIAWEGQQENWSALPDGRDVTDVVEQGALDTLPPCWLKISNTGTYGDMIWDGGAGFSFVSDRFVSAVQDAGFTDEYKLFPLEVQAKRGDRFPGYSLLLADNEDPEAPIRSYPFVYRSWSYLDVSGDVMAALVRAGATELQREDATTEAARLIEP